MTRMHNPAHPGEALREYLPENMTVTEAARRLKVTRQQLSALLNKRSGVSAEMALRLAAALGTSPEMWVSMQAAYGASVSPRSSASPLNPRRPGGTAGWLRSFR